MSRRPAVRLQLISDLHLERQTDFQTVAAPDVDLLVLAGDVGSYQAGSRLVTDDFGLGRFSPAREGAPWRRVLYVPGNHEYDGIDFATAQARLQSQFDALSQQVDNFARDSSYGGTNLISSQAQDATVRMPPEGQPLTAEQRRAGNRRKRLFEQKVQGNLPQLYVLIMFSFCGQVKNIRPRR